MVVELSGRRGVVYEDVDRSVEGLFGLGDDAAFVEVQVLEVQVCRDGCATGLPDHLQGFVERPGQLFVAPFLVSPHGNDLSSFSREPDGDALADAAARSRYDGHVPF